MSTQSTVSKINVFDRPKRKWFPLWVLDGYILREFLIKYSILMMVFIILFILSDVYNTISEFLEADAEWQDILLYLILNLPANIRFILPISMLLGCMWTMAGFGKNLEVTAMRASGLSLTRCSWSIFFVGLLMTFLNVYFNEYLIPKTEQEAQLLYDRAADRRKSVQHLLAFRSDDEQRNWLFQTFSIGSDQENVVIRTSWNEPLIRELLGEPGTPDFNDHLRGIFGEIRADELLRLAAPELERELIRQLLGRKMDIRAEKVHFDDATGNWYFRTGEYLSYDRQHERSIASSGISRMHPEQSFSEVVLSRRVLPETPRDILNSVREKDDLPTMLIWEVVKRNPRMPEKVRAIYMTVFYYRLAFPWACFLAVFLGIPLATKNERTGSMLAIIGAILLIVAYIVTAQVFLTFGKSGALPPVIAGLAPTLLFIGFSIWRTLSDRT